MSRAKKRIVRFSIFLLAIIFVLNTNCEKNINPIITSITASSLEVKAGENTSLSVQADDPEGAPLIYLWETNEGSISGDNNLSTITWTAPNISGNYYCSVSVNDGIGIVTDSIQISVIGESVLQTNIDTLFFDNNTTENEFNILNQGTGQLNWSLNYSSEDGESWIQSVSPETGSISKDNPSIVKVKIDHSDLAGGSYTGQITVSSEDKKVVVVVIVELAELSINPNKLEFGSTETQKNLSLENIGSGVIDYTLSSSDDWISFDPSSGNISDNLENIVVSVDRSGLSAGNHSGQIIVSSNLGDTAIPVKMTVNENPILKVDPTILDFSGSFSLRNFTIKNIGGGRLDWTINESVSWLNVSTIEGSTTTETEEIQVSIERSSLSPGSHQEEITINSNGGDFDITIKVEIANDPVLMVSHTELEFGTSKSLLTFSIVNDGGLSLDWTISETISWLSVNPSEGSSTTEVDDINVSVNRDGLSSGSHSDKILIESNGGTMEITVRIGVEGGPILHITPTVMNFGSDKSALDFSISNTGVRTLNWSITDNQDWLTTSQSEGTSTTETDNITVSVNRDGLAGGSHSGTITITSDGGTSNIIVEIEVLQEPILSISAAELDFGVSINSLNFDISNTGGETLTWTVSDNMNWLNLVTTSGTSTTETDNIIVQVDRSGLSPGKHEGTITVSSNGGNAQISVDIEVIEDPKLYVSRTKLDFGVSTNELNFNLANTGGQILTWTISETLNWLTVTPLNGTTTTEGENIQVLVDRSSLIPGLHEGIINITSDGGDVQVTVTIEKLEEPILDVSETTLDFGTAINDLSFNITNTGGQTLTWTINESLNWLTITPLTGTTEIETDVILVSVDRSVLSQGVSKSGLINITSNGGNAQILVDIETLRGPILTIGPLNLDFETTTNSLGLTILNGGEGSLDWEISENESWISLSQLSGSGTNDMAFWIDVTVDRAGLSEGIYTSKLSVTSNGGNTEINITMEVLGDKKWLINDDGIFEGGFHDETIRSYIMKFERPAGWLDFKITKIKLNFENVISTDQIELATYDYWEEDGSYYFFPIYYTSAVSNLSSGWNEWNVDWGYDTSTFYVGYYDLVNDATPTLSYDLTTTNLRSYVQDSDSYGDSVTDGNWAIRIFVEKASEPSAPGQWLDFIPDIKNKEKRKISNGISVNK